MPTVLCFGGVPKQNKMAIEAEIENKFVYYSKQQLSRKSYKSFVCRLDLLDDKTHALNNCDAKSMKKKKINKNGAETSIQRLTARVKMLAVSGIQLSHIFGLNFFALLVLIFTDILRD